VDSMQGDVKREFQRQQNEVGQKLRDSKSFGRGLYKVDVCTTNAEEDAHARDAGLTPARSQGPARSAQADLGEASVAKERIPPLSELFDLESEVAIWKKKFKKPISNVLMMIAKEQLARLGVAGDFDMTQPTVVNAVSVILNRVAQKTNESTWNDLTDLFKEAESAGESIPAIQERLATYFGNRKSDWETERIARTTMNSTANKGDLEAWRQSELVTGKIWIAALDDRTRDAHNEAHGQVVDLDAFFEVGGERLEEPGDGSPENSINCRCNMLPVTVEE
jgi:SPP1 gp7 family putative phage head morphogenesis protein